MKFLLTMRTEDDSWARLGEEARQDLIQRYFAWVETLKTGGFHGGAPIGPRTQELRREGDEVVHADLDPTDRPVSGYFIFEAEDWDAAREIASGCPALEHNETLELRHIHEVGV